MKLIILGNGFDIAQKNKIIGNQEEFDTSYLNFGKYLKDNYFEVYNFLNSISFIDIDNNEYWYRFEERLGNPNFKNLAKYMKDDAVGVKKYLNLDEVDAFDEFKDISIDMLKQLKRAFCRWINNKNKFLQSCVDEGNVEQLKIMKKFNKEDLFLSFNYTSTIEFVYNLFNVYYIHGCIMDYEDQINRESTLSNIVLGHKKDYLKSKFDYSNKDKINENILRIQNIYSKIFDKDCTDIIKNDSTKFFYELSKQKTLIDEVYILGHSIENVDIDYFEKIIEILCAKTKWYISSYKGDFNTKRARLNKLSDKLNVFECEIK